jgi:hypothetical protein
MACICQAQLRTALPIWYATHAHRLWTAYIAQVDEDLSQCDLRAQALEQQIRAASSQSESLRDIYLRTGGASVEQLRELRALKCEHGQGYLFSAAIPHDAVDEVLTADPVW